jgi:uncharacterized protein YdhG (YjbR/CyaY superfamily)
MNTSRKTAGTVDEYIAGFPADVQEKLEKVRTTIRSVIPDAEETISYQIPAFNVKGSNVIYFAGFKKHIGMYPVPFDDSELEDALARYTSGKATARFPLDEPIPVALIKKIVKVGVKRSMERAKAKAKAKAKKK